MCDRLQVSCESNDGHRPKVGTKRHAGTANGYDKFEFVCRDCGAKFTREYPTEERS